MEASLSLRAASASRMATSRASRMTSFSVRGDGKRDDGHFLMLELNLLTLELNLRALEFGLLRLERFILLLYRRSSSPQLSLMCLGLLGLLVSCGSLLALASSRCSPRIRVSKGVT